MVSQIRGTWGEEAAVVEMAHQEVRFFFLSTFILVAP